MTVPPPMHPGPRIPGPRYQTPFSSDHSGGLQSFHHHQARPRLGYQPYRLYPRALPTGGGITESSGQEYDGRRLRKSLVRKTVDYNAAIVKGLQVRTAVIYSYL